MTNILYFPLKTCLSFSLPPHRVPSRAATISSMSACPPLLSPLHSSRVRIVRLLAPLPYAALLDAARLREARRRAFVREHQVEVVRAHQRDLRSDVAVCAVPARRAGASRAHGVPHRIPRPAERALSAARGPIAIGAVVLSNLGRARRR